MKDQPYTNIICKNFCKYYNEGKEDISCRGYDILRKNLTPRELRFIIRIEKIDPHIKTEIPERNDNIFDLICKGCEFLKDGCDYSSNLSGPPCGGYNIFSKVIKL